MIQMNCPQCGMLLNVPDSIAGKKGRCSACKTVFDIAPPPPPAVAPPAPVQQPPPPAPMAAPLPYPQAQAASTFQVGFNVADTLQSAAGRTLIVGGLGMVKSADKLRDRNYKGTLEVAPGHVVARGQSATRAMATGMTIAGAAGAAVGHAIGTHIAPQQEFWAVPGQARAHYDQNAFKAPSHCRTADGWSPGPPRAVRR